MEVVIGLVEYTQAVYPVQGSYINTFDANTFVQLTTHPANAAMLFPDGTAGTITAAANLVPSYTGY